MSSNINWLANLSKIDFSEDELKKMELDMQSIIHLMDSIKEIDLPTVEVFEQSTTLSETRIDTVKQSIPTEILTSQTNSDDKGCFSIPIIVE